MSRRRVAKTSLALAIFMMVVSGVGLVAFLVLNAFVFDDYDAYGEVPVPGTGSVHLPAGEASVSLHALVVGSADSGLPVPPLRISIDPPDGVPQPTLTESMGGTTTINSDAHVRVWTLQVPAEGTYNVTTDGQVNGYISPRLAFGHQSSYGYLPWVFGGLFVFGLIDLAVSIVWLARIPRTVVSVSRPYLAGSPVASATSGPPAPARAGAYEPTGEGVRLERLKTLAALRDSGALSEAEFQQEKRRILDEL